MKHEGTVREAGDGLPCGADAANPSRGKIWLASYPRSGNTYLRTILHSCFGLPSTSVYPRDLGGNTGLERLAGHFEADGGHPDPSGRNPVLVKTHEYPKDDAPAIYVVRDGRAATVSLWEFQSRRPPLPAIIINRAWSDHLTAWSPWDRPCTLLLRYEEMVDDLPSVLDSLSGFLGMPPISSVPPTRAEMAAVGGRWVRKHSDWRAKVSERDMRLFNTFNGSMMRRLGYAPDGCHAGRTAGGETGPMGSNLATQLTIRYWRLRNVLRPIRKAGR